MLHTPTISYLAAALDYAARGWHVFPLHGIVAGKCTCGHACDSPGKHPIVKGGYKAATTDPEQIKSWWRKWPTANVAIATGAVSDLIVIDLDGEGGEAQIRELEQLHGPLTPTWMVRTARGRHLYYRLPASTPRTPCSSGGGLDVRCEGGYCVAPPSVHVSGHVYRWVAP